MNSIGSVWCASTTSKYCSKERRISSRFWWVSPSTWTTCFASGQKESIERVEVAAIERVVHGAKQLNVVLRHL